MHRGDPLPDAVAALLAAYASGDAEAAAACCARDALWAPPSDDRDETAPRAIHEGAGAIRAAIAADPELGRTHTVRVCLHEGGDCMIEGDILSDDGPPARSHAMGFQLDEGRIARALVFRCDPVEDNGDAVDENATAVDIREELD